MISKLRPWAGKVVRSLGRLIPDRVPDGTRFFSSHKAQIFFGYYDVSPFSHDADKLLAMRTAIGNISPHDTDEALDIGYYDLGESQQGYIKIAESRAWNWQQGCRLQWLANSRQHILFNDYNGKRFVTRIFNVDNKELVHTLDMPVYAVSPDGACALGLNFTMLHKHRRGYGYHHEADGQFDPAIAIYEISLENGKTCFSIAMDDVRKCVKDAPYDHDYINHLSYAPDGKSFMFFYIRLYKGKRTTHLLYAENGGKTLRHIVCGYSPSHYAWHDDGRLLLTALNNDTKRTEYILVNPVADHFSRLVNGGLNVDGHPTFLNGYTFISDTYPSRLGHQAVFKDRIDQAMRKEIASFYLPLAFTEERRCDLHPRLSKCGKFVCVDVVRSKRRAMAIMPLEDDVR